MTAIFDVVQPLLMLLAVVVVMRVIFWVLGD